jgi:predicted O-linked N-acetylglucosamine transferase (SPINDLY family)
MSELITNDQDDYESVAVDLASNRNKMNSIKKKLARNLENAPLFNTKSFTMQIEKSYAEIYEKNQIGLEPDHIYIKA